MPQPIQSKRDTANAWTLADTVLAPGQIGIEVGASTGAKMKVGINAGTPWNSLGYVEGAIDLTALPGREPFAFSLPVQGSSVATHLGGGVTPLDSSVAGARTPAATSLMTVLTRVGYTGAVGGNRFAGASYPAGTSTLLAPTASIAWGFKMRLAAAIGDALAGSFGIGFAPPISPGAWTPSAMLNCCFLGADAGDSQMTVMHNGSSGTCTKITLNGGSGFPHNTNFLDLYSFTVEFRSNGSTRSLAWTAKNMVTNISVSGTVPEGSKMPVAGTVLGEFYLRGSPASGIPIIEFYGKQIGPYA